MGSEQGTLHRHVGRKEVRKGHVRPVWCTSHRKVNYSSCAQMPIGIARRPIIMGMLVFTMGVWEVS